MCRVLRLKLYPIYTHQTILLCLGPANSAHLIPLISPNPNPTQFSLTCWIAFSGNFLPLSVSTSIFIYFCFSLSSLFLPLCFCLFVCMCLSVSVSLYPLANATQTYQTQQQGLVWPWLWQDWVGQWAIPWTPKLTGPSSATTIGLGFQKLLRSTSVPALPQVSCTCLLGTPHCPQKHCVFPPAVP